MILKILILFLIPTLSFGQELVQDEQFILKAEVLQVLEQEKRLVPGTDVESNYQTIEVRILEGKNEGDVVIIENDYLSLEEGQKFYMRHTIDAISGTDYYSVVEPYRLPVVYFFIGLFLLCVVLFGGMQGIRGILSLVLSLFFIIYILLPGVLNGYSPILLSIGVSSLIIIAGSYITHGFNKTTTSAVIGMVITIIITGILAYIAVNTTNLSGFESEEAIYLNLNTRGAIDFVGLLLGGIMIGLLGVLYDAGIAQAVAVEELSKAGPHLSRKSIYKRAIRIGREHIGALVDTLAIAYVGASLPLLLLFYINNPGINVMLNQEIFSTEIIRTIIGSIGLILAVPITTLISSILLVKKEGTDDLDLIKKEEEAIKHLGHSH